MYTVGLALLANERLADAERAFTRAIRLAPRFADAWLNLGVTLYRREKIEDAKAAMRQVLAITPGHRAATANLGAFLRLTGLVDDGETLLRDLLKRDPEAAEARLNLTVHMLSEQRGSEALALLDERPAPAEPRLRQHWLVQRSMALLQVGRTEAAREVLSSIDVVAPEQTPLLLWRRALLALAEGDSESARARVCEIEEALGQVSGSVPEHRIMAHFDLARFWSQQGEPDRAFPHWREGHRVLGRFQPFSREAHRQFVNETIARFDSARLHQGARAGNNDPTPVFIVGMPRSGTTLAEQIIAAHPQTFGAGERLALHATYIALAGNVTAEAPARVAKLGDAELDDAAQTYLAELHRIAPGAARVVDKMPGNSNFLGLVALMLPGARIIHCTRDPRDIGLSIFTFRFTATTLMRTISLTLAGTSLSMSGSWRIGVRLCRTRSYPCISKTGSRISLVPCIACSDSSASPRYVLGLRALFRTGPPSAAVSRAQVRQPVNARGIGRWRGYERHLGPLITALAEAEIDPPDGHAA